MSLLFRAVLRRVRASRAFFINDLRFSRRPNPILSDLRPARRTFFKAPRRFRALGSGDIIRSAAALCRSALRRKIMLLSAVAKKFQTAVELQPLSSRAPCGRLFEFGNFVLALVLPADRVRACRLRPCGMRSTYRRKRFRRFQRVMAAPAVGKIRQADSPTRNRICVAGLLLPVESRQAGSLAPRGLSAGRV